MIISEIFDPDRKWYLNDYWSSNYMESPNVMLTNYDRYVRLPEGDKIDPSVASDGTLMLVKTQFDTFRKCCYLPIGLLYLQVREWQDKILENDFESESNLSRFSTTILLFFTSCFMNTGKHLGDYKDREEYSYRIRNTLGLHLTEDGRLRINWKKIVPRQHLLALFDGFIRIIERKYEESSKHYDTLQGIENQKLNEIKYKPFLRWSYPDMSKFFEGYCDDYLFYLISLDELKIKEWEESHSPLFAIEITKEKHPVIPLGIVRFGILLKSTQDITDELKKGEEE